MKLYLTDARGCPCNHHRRLATIFDKRHGADRGVFKRRKARP